MLACWHETDSDLLRLSLAMLVSDRLRPGDRAAAGPYVTFLAKRLPAGNECRFDKSAQCRQADTGCVGLMTDTRAAVLHADCNRSIPAAPLLRRGNR